MSNITNTPKIQNLIICIIGSDQFISLPPIFKLINEAGGNVTNSKISQFNNHFVGAMIVDGRWDAITKIEQAFNNNLESKLNIKIQCQRSDMPSQDNGSYSDSEHDINSESDNSEEIMCLPYKISINNLDEPGLLQKIIEFFVLQEITIQDLNATTYIAEFGAELAQIDIKIKVPSDIHIPSLREQFDVLCYNENLDASLTPHKAI
ncbi:MAG: hypothetical protein KBD64_03605 [Gammaproteobacteria bacterium]|nr:hypothetical protein [Gammaproteobacteria bacterium]